MLAQLARVIAEGIQGCALRPAGIFPFRLGRKAIAVTTARRDLAAVDPIERRPLLSLAQLREILTVYWGFSPSMMLTVCSLSSHSSPVSGNSRIRGLVAVSFERVLELHLIGEQGLLRQAVSECRTPVSLAFLVPFANDEELDLTSDPSRSRDVALRRPCSIPAYHGG